MASLWKHPQSKYWTACFTDGLGRRRKRSTGTVDRRAAMRLAEQFEQAGRNRRTARQVREVIGDLHREITGEDLPAVTVGGYFDAWFKRRANETAPATLAFYRGTAGKFLAFLGEGGGEREIGEITREDVTGFRDGLAETLAPKTVNHCLKGLRSIFKNAKRDGALTENPAEFVDTVRQVRDDGARRAFTLPELRSVLAVADSEWQSLVKFGLYTGQRLGDLARLTWANVDLARAELRFVTVKTGRRMVLPIAAPLRRHLESLPAGDVPDAPLHPRSYALIATRKGQVAALSQQFAELLAQAGFRAKTDHGKTAAGTGRSGARANNALTFHSLRRTATTFMHEAGIPAAVAQEIIGHDSAEVHRLYVNVGREAMERAAAALPEV